MRSLAGNVAVAGLFAGLIACAGCASDRDREPVAPAPAREPEPATADTGGGLYRVGDKVDLDRSEIAYLDGKSGKLADFRGKVLMLNFFSYG